MKHLLTLFILNVAAAQADTTISPTLKYAYSANAGWINFRHDQPASPNGVIVGESFFAGLAYGANFGWINFGDGTPANGMEYQNNSATDFGVNHNGAGCLSGMAYGANTGWINFGWAAANDVNRPRVNLLTGEFSGMAYSANMGWINLGAGTLTTLMVRITDTDTDGMADAWERAYFSNLTSAGLATDADKDGVSDADEYLAGTSPDLASDYFKIASTTFSSGNTQATVTFTTDPTRVYRIETSDNLVNWQNSALGIFAPDPGTATTRTVTWTGNQRRFIRAIAIRPLSVSVPMDGTDI